MSISVNVGDVFRLACYIQDDDESDIDIVNMHYVCTIKGTGGDPRITLSNAWATAVAADFQAVLPLNAKLLYTAVYRKASFTGGVGIKNRSTLLYNTPAGWPLAGTVTGAVLPSQDAAILSFYTETVGRKGRGRVYVPDIPASLQSTAVNDFISAAGLVLYRGLALAMLGPITDSGGNTFFLCVYGETKKGVLPYANHYDIPATITAQQVIRTQRRRQFQKRIHRR